MSELHEAMARCGFAEADEGKIRQLLAEVFLQADRGEPVRDIYQIPDPVERVDFPLDLEDDLLLVAALGAHEQNITLNQYVTRILEKEIERIQRESNEG